MKRSVGQYILALFNERNKKRGDHVGLYRDSYIYLPEINARGWYRRTVVCVLIGFWMLYRTQHDQLELD